MTDTKWTDEPLTVEYDNHGNGSYSEWFNVGPAQVHVRSRKPEDRERAERFANLIAAAPDLYEQLEHVLVMYGRGDIQITDDLPRAEMRIWAERTGRALKEARGET